MVYRRFGTVIARLLLNKQDEIAELEKSLVEMDGADAKDDRRGRCLLSRTIDESMPPDRKEWPKTRPEILKELEEKVLEYSLSSYLMRCFHWTLKMYSRQTNEAGPAPGRYESTIQARSYQRSQLHAKLRRYPL